MNSLIYNIVIIVLLSLFVIIHNVNGDFADDFWKPVFTNAPKFKSSQLYNIDNIGFQGYNGSVVAFGDFNADKYLDTFFLHADKSTLQIFLWDIEGWKYDESDLVISLPDGYYITNVVATDFNYDGALDILVQGTYTTNTTNGTTTSTFMEIYLGEYTSIVSEPTILFPSAISQVLLLDINNDLHVDIFGSSDTGNRTLWINNDDRFSTQQLAGSQGLPPISNPHSNSFVDFNGDCLADLFITSGSSENNTLQGEIWINNKQDGYTLVKVLPLPQGTGQITFSDFDGDGDLDMLYPVCWPQPSCSQVNSLYLVYNNQKPVCSSSLFSNPNKCRPQNQLCLVDNSFYFSSTLVNDGQTMVLTKDSFNGLSFYSDLENNIPFIIHTGDYNIDGYPDLLISFYDPNDPTATPHLELWENSQGNGFFNQTSGTSALTSIRNAYAGAFVDFGENGIADILVLTRVNGSESVQAVFNNFYNDAFFFKTLGLNGVCTTMCSSGKKFPSPKPYGVNFPGGIFKFIYSDIGGKTHLQIGAQMYQSSHMALLTPYNLFGLGRTSNYVDQLFYGCTLNQTIHYNNWVGTIPNSQVVAIPYKSSVPTSWTLELFINPSGIFFWVMIAFFVALIVLSLISFGLYKREKKQDEKLKQEQAHLFSFSAL